MNRKYKVATSILGADFITPKQVSKCLGLVYTQEQEESLLLSMPDRALLKSLKMYNFYLAPTPNKELNFFGVNNLNNSGFIECGFINGDFANNDIIMPCQWMALYKGAFPGSSNKSWDKQKITGDAYIPNATELSYLLQVYASVRCIHILKDDEGLRTSSVDEDKNHVCVAHPVGCKPKISVVWKDYPIENIGVSCVFKFTRNFQPVFLF